MQRPIKGASDGTIDITHNLKEIPRLRSSVARTFHCYDPARSLIVELNNVEISERLYAGNKFPVCTYEGKTLPPMDSLFIATANGYAYEPDIKQLAHDLSCKLEAFILNAIEMGDTKFIDIVNLIITKFILPTSQYLNLCFKHNQPKIAEMLLNNSLVKYDTLEIERLVDDKNHHFTPEIMLLFYYFIKAKNRRNDTQRLIDKISKKENCEEAIINIIQDERSWLRTCAKNAVVNHHFDLLKRIISEVPPETGEALINALFKLGVPGVHSSYYLEKTNNNKFINQIRTACYLVEHATKLNEDNTPEYFLKFLGVMYKNVVERQLHADLLNSLLQAMQKLNEHQAYRPDDVWSMRFTYEDLMKKKQYDAAQHFKDANKNNPVLVILFEKENQEEFIKQLKTSLTSPIIIKYFKCRHRDLWEPNEQTKNLFLHTAVFMGEADVVSFILSTHDYALNRNIINFANKDGKSALRLAIELNNAEIVGIFIKHIANILGRAHETPLISEDMFQLACSLGHHEIALALKTAIFSTKQEKTSTPAGNPYALYSRGFSSAQSDGSRPKTHSPM